MWPLGKTHRQLKKITSNNASDMEGSGLIKMIAKVREVTVLMLKLMLHSLSKQRA